MQVALVGQNLDTAPEDELLLELLELLELLDELELLEELRPELELLDEELLELEEEELDSPNPGASSPQPARISEPSRVNKSAESRVDLPMDKISLWLL